MPVDLKVWEKIIGEKGSAWRKVFWWVLIGLFFTVIAIIFILFFPLIKIRLFDDEKVVSAVKGTIDGLTVKLNQVDTEAKIKAAEAAGVEKAKIEQIRNTAKITNEYERAEALARLAKEDY